MRTSPPYSLTSGGQRRTLLCSVVAWAQPPVPFDMRIERTRGSGHQANGAPEAACRRLSGAQQSQRSPRAEKVVYAVRADRGQLFYSACPVRRWAHGMLAHRGGRGGIGTVLCVTCECRARLAEIVRDRGRVHTSGSLASVGPCSRSTGRRRSTPPIQAIWAIGASQASTSWFSWLGCGGSRCKAG